MGLLPKYLGKQHLIQCRTPAISFTAQANMPVIIALLVTFWLTATVSVLVSCFTALLMLITVAVNQSCICTFHLPINRVRLSPCNSLPKAKIPSTLVFRCLRRSSPMELDNLALASPTNCWSKKRLIVRSCPAGVHCSLNRQPLHDPGVMR